MKIITHSSEETIKVAEKLGSLLKAGDTIAYKGGLGAGKTTFTRGLAIGLGLGDTVSSPTFILVNEYTGEKISLYHFDMYRIKTDGDLESSGFWDYDFINNVTVIEWSDNIADLLPKNTIFITINFLGDNNREIIIKGCENFAVTWN